MVKVDLITGFLGSGKTTFLLKYAKHLIDSGLKIGILEYDYGAVNIDMLLLRQLQGDRCTLEMLAAACDEDCLKRRFKTKLIAMAMSGYDRVIIEPSGVFDMDLFFDTLRDEPLEDWYEIGSVITIVDATLDTETDLATDYFLVSQVASAGKVLLSKAQLATKDNIVATQKCICEAAERVHCKKFEPNYIEKNWDCFTNDDLEELVDCGYHITSCDKTLVSSETEFSSVCFLDAQPGLDIFCGKVNKLFDDTQYGSILRIKGFIKDLDGKGYQINATKNRITVDPMARGQGTVIVIGKGLDKEKIKQVICTGY